MAFQGVYGMTRGLALLRSGRAAAFRRTQYQVGIVQPNPAQNPSQIVQPVSGNPFPTGSLLAADQDAVLAAQAALDQANANMKAAGNFDPLGVLQAAINTAGAALAAAQKKLALDQQNPGTLGPPPGGTPSPTAQPSKWTTPILGGLLLLAGVGIVYAYEQPKGKRAFA